MADLRSPADRIDAARRWVRRQARRARVRLWVERLAGALWPLWALGAGFLGLALLGLPQTLPFAGHIALLGAFGVAALWFLVAAVRGWRTPTGAEARARLDEGQRERPVAALDDALAAGSADPATQAVWAAHRTRMADRAMAARAPKADLRVSHRDPFALRHAAGLALAAGLIAQLGDGGARLVEALTPVGGASAAAAQAPAPSLEAWASPPLYTRAAPIYLTERLNQREPISLPAGSEVTLRVFDAPAAPRIAADGLAGEAVLTETGGAWGVTLTLESSGSLEIAADGATFGGWRFEAVPDAPPTVAFTEGPARERDGSLGFGFVAQDDHGVVEARAELALDVAAAGPLGLAPDTVFEPIAFELPLPLRGAAAEAGETVTRNLTENPWAGLPVVLTLIVADAAGQEARVEARLDLPARRFREPLARAIVEQRRDLAWSVETAPRVRDVIDALTAHPDDVFTDASAYLITRTARRRLGYAVDEARVRDETPGVAELLWQAALKIEDGELSDVERRLRELQQELSEALERGADQDEIAQLMDELRRAIQEMMRQLAQEMMDNLAEGQEPQQVDPDQMMSQQDLADMLDRLEEALRNGMEDLARQMLQDLAQLLENLQMAQPGQQGQQGEGDQAMQELQDMIGQQQGLADRSFDALRQQRQQGQGGEPGEGGEGEQGQGQQQGQGRQGEGQAQGGEQGPGGGQGRADQGRPGGPDLGSIARDQEGLRQLLDDLRRGLPGNEALDRAEREMGSARESLEQGDAEGALQDQVEALDALREGAQELAEQMQQEPGQAQQAGREGRSGDVRDEDPFGRPTATDGPLDGDSVRVPDAAIANRARELMDEIRRRSGERSRSESELDYLRRLLERF